VDDIKACGKVKVQLHSFVNSALDGVSGQLHVPAVALPVKKSQLRIRSEGQWAPRTVCTVWKRKFCPWVELNGDSCDAQSAV